MRSSTKENKMEKEKKNKEWKTSTTLDMELKQKAENKFKSYGVNFSSGLAILLTAFIDDRVQIFK